MDPDLDELRAAAQKVFPTAQAADAFLRLHAPALGGIPIELAKAGREREVLAFLERLAAEAPAPPPSIFGLPLGGWFRRK
jgi:hypothetical protein